MLQRTLTPNTHQINLRHTHRQLAQVTNHAHPAHGHTQSTDTHTQTGLAKHMRCNTHNQPTQTPNHAKPKDAAHCVHTKPTHILNQAHTARNQHPESQ